MPKPGVKSPFLVNLPMLKFLFTYNNLYCVQAKAWLILNMDMFSIN